MEETVKRDPDLLQQVDRTFVLLKGRKLVYFGGCDYFRLASHPAVLAAGTSGAPCGALARC